MPFTKRMFKKLKNLKKHVTFNGRRKRNNSELDIEELQQSLCIVNEENLSIKKQIKLELEKLTQENLTLKEKYETEKVLFDEDKRFLCNEINLLRSEINEKQMEMEKIREDNVSLKKEYKSIEELLKDERELNQVLENDKYRLEQEISKLNKDVEDIRSPKIMKVRKDNSSGSYIDALMEEVESLRVVLELKQNEIKKLQLALVEAKQKEEGFEVVARNVRLLKTKCVDLEEQLKRKSERKKTLEEEIYKLRKVILDENAKMKRLSYQNEELLWKLESKRKSGLETVKCDPQVSPQIRRFVNKRGSIGYVLNLDERPKKVKKLQETNEPPLDERKELNVKVGISY